MPQQLLTRRKERWVKRRQPELVRGGALNNPSVLEARYYAKLQNLIDRMTADVEKQLRRFFEKPHAEEYFEAMDASVSSQARILTNALMKKFNSLFSANAPMLADQQANAVDKYSSTAMHSSLKELSGGLSLPTSAISADMKEILTASIAENVGLIKSISQQYLTGVQGAVMRSITSGQGMADLVPFLEKHKGITLRRARFIARDQTKKAYESLNTGRMENLGLDKYIWLHSGGSHNPRKLHQEMSGNVYSIKNPPIIDKETGQRGGPGDLPGCNCRKRPVIEYGD